MSNHVKADHIDCMSQMTKCRVGSLLVFDPSKIDLAPSEATTMKSAHEDAVVGIITERGKQQAELTEVDDQLPHYTL